jgi:hypothetical protein
LQRAENQGILIFRAADIATSNSNSYTEIEAGIRIGTTPELPLGQIWRRTPVALDNAEFFFPAEESLIKSTLRMDSDGVILKSPHTLATAVACGVAALILYCIRFIEKESRFSLFDLSGQRLPNRGWEPIVMSKSRMNKIIRNTCNRDDGQYSEFWKVFAKYNTDNLDHGDKEMAIQALRELVQDLCKE